MALETNVDDYDENSVFKRLFAKQTMTAVANSGSQLDRIFEGAKAPAETINVMDFLPIY